MFKYTLKAHGPNGSMHDVYSYNYMTLKDLHVVNQQTFMSGTYSASL